MRELEEEHARLTASVRDLTRKVLPKEKLLHINLQRFRGGLVFKAHRLCVSLNSRLESNKEEEEAELAALAASVRDLTRKVFFCITKSSNV